MVDCNNQYGIIKKFINKIIQLSNKYLQGWSMSQVLPTGDFCWEDIDQWYNEDGNVDIQKIMRLQAESERGYMFEVDIGEN